MCDGARLRTGAGGTSGTWATSDTDEHLTSLHADVRLASAGQSGGQEDLGLSSNLTVLRRRR